MSSIIEKLEFKVKSFTKTLKRIENELKEYENVLAEMNSLKDRAEYLSTQIACTKATISNLKKES